MNTPTIENDIQFVVGDIHGRADLLEHMLCLLERSAIQHNAVKPSVVFLGDYIDRGPDSKKVIELLINGLPKFEKIFLRGNHEELLQSFLHLNTMDSQNLTYWIKRGGSETLESYGVKGDYNKLPKVIASLKENIPFQHYDFFQNLKSMHETSSSLFVHAGFNPAYDLDHQNATDMAWIRKPFLESEKDWGKFVYHGHTPSSFGPDVKKHRMNIDTGAAWTGILTAAIVGDSPRFLVATEPRERVILWDPSGIASDWWWNWASLCAFDSKAKRLQAYSPIKHIDNMENISDANEFISEYVGSSSNLLIDHYDGCTLVLTPDENSLKYLDTNAGRMKVI
jgi:serine/threonine protein phosphatase 1